MNNQKRIGDETRQVLLLSWLKSDKWKHKWWQKLRGGILLVLGYLLSPLCWWNDLFFNLPIAYGFGYICSRFSPNLLVPAALIGYWLSNIAGILLMQVGAVSVFQQGSQEHNSKKDLLTGLISSTIYTVIILILVKLKVLEMPALFADGINLINISFINE